MLLAVMIKSIAVDWYVESNYTALQLVPKSATKVFR